MEKWYHHKAEEEYHIKMPRKKNISLGIFVFYTLCKRSLTEPTLSLC